MLHVLTRTGRSLILGRGWRRAALPPVVEDEGAPATVQTAHLGTLPSFKQLPRNASAALADPLATPALGSSNDGVVASAWRQIDTPFRHRQTGRRAQARASMPHCARAPLATVWPRVPRHSHPNTLNRGSVSAEAFAERSSRSSQSARNRAGEAWVHPPQAGRC